MRSWQVLLALAALCSSCLAGTAIRHTLDLNGSWEVRLRTPRARGNNGFPARFRLPS